MNAEHNGSIVIVFYLFKSQLQEDRNQQPEIKTGKTDF